MRTQIFNKFKSLGVLKDRRFQIVSSSAKNPVIGFLKTGIKSIEDADSLFESNVIVSTPQIITGILSGDEKKGIIPELVQSFNYG
ncbi:hypothetical protein LWM68_13415 [Niabella sp. W65]|nr:hypothetical protein [Niabella sp. W65]MCH7363659.1 hypothetical protein [Niabella sp. W65]